MAIKVFCKDGSLEIGGAFADALAVVKAVPGRQYDGSLKAWRVGISCKEMAARTSLQIILPSGERVFPGGNRYTTEEWELLKEEHQRVEAAVDAAQDAEISAIRWLKSRIAALGLPEAAQKKLIGIIANAGGDGLSGAEEEGKIQFSSAERRSLLLGIEDEYLRRVNAAYDAANL